MIALETDIALLAGVGEVAISALEPHPALHGPGPDLRKWKPEEVIALVRKSGLRGPGGASFPVADKLRAVASRRRAPSTIPVRPSSRSPAQLRPRASTRSSTGCRSTSCWMSRASTRDSPPCRSAATSARGSGRQISRQIAG